MMAKATRRRRANGEGSLYQTKSGLWRGAVTYTDPETGTTKRSSVASRSQSVARERLTALRRQLDLGSMPVDGSLTVGDYLDRWLEALRPRVKPSTWRSHDLAVRLYLRPSLGGQRVSRLTPTDVERMMARLQAKGHTATARNARATLRQALNAAVRDGAATRNVAVLATPPRAAPREMKVLSATEVRSLLGGTEDDEHGPLLALLVLTGMRSGEAFALMWHDHDTASATLAVRGTLAKGWDGEWRRAEPKTERSRRTLPLPDAATIALRRQSANQKRKRLAAGSAWDDQGFIFTDAIGRPLRQWVVGAALTRSLERLGLPHVRVHDLRHTAASMMLAQGVPLRTVSEHLGHAGLAITADLYVHLGEAQRREAAEALQRAVTGR